MKVARPVHRGGKRSNAPTYPNHQAYLDWARALVERADQTLAELEKKEGIDKNKLLELSINNFTILNQCVMMNTDFMFLFNSIT